MTLLIAMSKPDGLYLSADFRVTRSGRSESEQAIKFLTVHFALKDGPRALMGFTGLAELSDGTGVGDWLRETIRGEDQSFDQTMSHLLGRLNRDLRKYRAALIINILAVHGTRRFFGGFSNVRQFSPQGNAGLTKEFGYRMHELDQSYCFFNGSGAATAVKLGLHELVKSQLDVVPRKTHDHLKLLATVNRRVAAVDKTVSPHSHVTFLPGSDRFSPTSHTFREADDPSIPFRMPLITQGIDLDYLMQQSHARFTKFFAGEEDVDDDIDVERANLELRRRP